MKSTKKPKQPPFTVEDNADPCAGLLRLREIDPATYRKVQAAIDACLATIDQPLEDAGLFAARLARIGPQETN